VTLAPIPKVLVGRRVLVVDDDPDMRELVAESLTDAGAEVRVVETAEAALVSLAAFAPHVLLCDVSLPDEDGYSLMRRIRALPEDRGGRVRAVAFTGYARREDRELAMNAGFDLHLTKPADAVAIALALANLIDA
jgi:CheY-like chemotaxis protein